MKNKQILILATEEGNYDSHDEEKYLSLETEFEIQTYRQNACKSLPVGVNSALGYWNCVEVDYVVDVSVEHDSFIFKVRVRVTSIRNMRVACSSELQKLSSLPHCVNIQEENEHQY